MVVLMVGVMDLKKVACWVAPKVKKMVAEKDLHWELMLDFGWGRLRVEMMDISMAVLMVDLKVVLLETLWVV